MEIDFLKVRNVILDDRWRKCYKPDRAAISRIGQLLPDANIFGFGFRQDKGYWGVLVESHRFPDNPIGVIRDVSIKDLHFFSEKKLIPQKKGWLWKS